MLRPIFLLLICITFLFSCKEEEIPLPISEEQLIPILVDVHIAEAAVQNVRYEIKDSISDIYYEQIFTIHKVEEKDFYETMDHLKRDAIKLEAIYAQVLEELSKKEAKSGK